MRNSRNFVEMISRNMKGVELLAPAKNIEIGKAAINAGADAVYIGAQQFGARQSAGNSMEDIAQLAQHAHFYNSKVFLTLNTILFEHELEAARQLVYQAYDAGVDALIVQDMGLLEMDLPPIELHASTQTNNYDLEKVKFLEDVGFQRVVLARELSLDQIRNIRQNTNVDLEYFVAGALCVSLSGQCYMSQAMGGRSANRGACAQPCRLPYTLLDKNQESISRKGHFLSMKDLNLSASVEDLMLAGVKSFKIEGRLKDLDYVKNMVGTFRRELDAAIHKHPEYHQDGSGKVIQSLDFDPKRTFNRGFTDYFFNGRHMGIGSVKTPKAIGNTMAKVSEVKQDRFKVTLFDNNIKLNNGDGLCFFDQRDRLQGLKVNKVENDWVYPASALKIARGTTLYRNHDHEYQRLLEKSKTERKIGLSFEFRASDEGLVLSAKDEDDNTSCISYRETLEAAKNPDAVKAGLEKQLKKTGNTPFAVRELSINMENTPYIPASVINNMRRQAIEEITELRLQSYKREEYPFVPNEVPFGKTDLDFNANITNSLAEQFYRRHGVENIKKGFELMEAVNGEVVMTTKHCLKYEAGFCKVHENAPKKRSGKPLPMYLSDGERNYRLKYDCKNCFMKVIFTK